MLIVGFRKIGKTYLAQKYKDKVIELNYKDNLNIVQFIEAIKTNLTTYDVVIIPYLKQLLICLDALNISYTLVYPCEERKQEFLEYWNEYETFNQCKGEKLILKSNEFLEQGICNLFDWINIEKVKLPIPQNKNHLTIEQLLDEDVEISDADIRELKATQNKLKVGMLLQAKNSLNRILKLSNILDKLYDELLNRIDDSLQTTDTASLMYTTEYISKALNETNQFIVNLISNDKIQNFFIIDNSNVINIQENNIDLDSRERIRKAVSVVLNNLDLFEKGDFTNLKDPNNIENNEVN